MPIHFQLVLKEEFYKFDLQGDLVELTNKFNKNKKLSPFLNTGLMIDGKVSTIKTEANYEGEEYCWETLFKKVE